MNIERTRCKKMEAQRPSWRIQRVMARLSRERWIPGEEYWDTVVHLSKKISYDAWGRVARAAGPSECEIVGMIHGEPPAYILDKDYRDFVKALHGKKFSGIAGEMKIFQLFLRRQQWNQTK